MLSFNPRFKFSELGNKINEGCFDDDIKEYLNELISDGEDIKSPGDYFDVTVEYDNGDGFCCLYPGAFNYEIEKLTKNEKQLLALFEDRINFIFGGVINA